MSNEKLRAMVRAIVEQADYDLAKSLDPETAEDPGFAEELMASLVNVAREHVEAKP